MEGFIYGASRSFRHFMEQVEGYAATDWPVLILGETGVGKDLIANFIHRLSSRRSRTIVTLNANTLPTGLFESELFGYEKGAFSGALTSQRGIFRAAHESSLFLDEIGDLDANVQTKFLRVLESGEVRSIGSTRTDRINVRLITATNVNIFAAVSAGEFRRDLLERLSVLRLEVPPLRERVEDIALITHHICQTHNITIAPEAAGQLLEYHWPGNIRQLRNVLVRAGALSQNKISSTILEHVLSSEQRHFPRREQTPPNDLSKLTLADIERTVIENKIQQCRGNKKLAAESLGIAKSTLHEKMRKYREAEPVCVR